MTQKKLDWAKKKAKECLEVFDIKVPMTKMKIYFCVNSDENFHVNFIDVRTGNFFACVLLNNVYEVKITYPNTDKPILMHASKGGETID